MNQAAVWAIAGSSVIVVFSGVAMSDEGSEGSLAESVEKLFGLADETLDDTIRDLSRLPIHIQSAHGSAEDDAIDELLLMVKAKSEVALDGVVILDEKHRPLEVRDVQILRDRDYSLPEVLNGSDLCIFKIPLPEPWHARDEHRITMDVEGHSSGSFLIQVPISLDPMTKLDIRPDGA